MVAIPHEVFESSVAPLPAFLLRNAQVAACIEFG